VSVIPPPPKTRPGLQEAASMSSVDKLEASHPTDSGNGIINVLENMFETSMGILPMCLFKAKMASRIAG